MYAAAESEWVIAKARELGFDLCGIAAVEELADAGHLKEWLERGYAGRNGKAKLKQHWPDCARRQAPSRSKLQRHLRMRRVRQVRHLLTPLRLKYPPSSMRAVRGPIWPKPNVNPKSAPISRACGPKLPVN